MDSHRRSKFQETQAQRSVGDERRGIGEEIRTWTLVLKKSRGSTFTDASMQKMYVLYIPAQSGIGVFPVAAESW